MTRLIRTSTFAQHGIVPLGVVLFLLLGLMSVAMAQGAPVSREQPKSAVVISRVGGETVRFSNENAFRELVVGQELAAGDVIRTGPTGALGLLFVDRTAMRLHPNTELAIKEVSQSQSALELTSGKVWARTPRQSTTPVSVQTPSAAAAIRGTDWTLSVSAANVTSVFVYDGEVELSNARGVLTAGAGSGASASQGAAPQAVQVVTLAERQQMLLSVTPGAAADAVIRFEQSLAAQGETPAAYREGIRLVRAARFDEAAALLDRAAATLDPERAAAARWIAAFARAEAGAPIANMPARGQQVDAFGRAYYAAYSGDLAAASAALAPLSDEPVALSEAVSFAVYLDRSDEAKRLLDQLQSAAPRSAPALSAEAIVAHIVNGNPSRAVTLYRQAVALEPENPFLLNRLAMAEREVGHPIEAEAALRRALELAPGDTNIQGNLVTVLLDQYQIREAQGIVDRLNETAPGSYTSLSSLAHLASRQGDLDFARAAALDSLAAQPAASENSILLAIAAHRAGDDTRAQQELDAAKRLDPNNPNIPAIRAAIALDYARANAAIVAALEADRLFRQNLAAERLSANRKSGSVMTAAFENLGLTDWARDIADRSHDPMSASSLFTDGLIPRTSIGRDSSATDARDSDILASELQGLLIDPLGGVGRLRFSDLVLAPFLDGQISYTKDADTSRQVYQLTGFTTAPVPLGFSLGAGTQTLDANPYGDIGDVRVSNALIFTRPTARLGLFAFYNSPKFEDAFSSELRGIVPGESYSLDAMNAGAALSYRLRERDILSFVATSYKQDIRERVVDIFGLDDLEDIDYIDEYEDWSAQEFTENSAYQDKFFGLSYRGDDSSGTWFAGYERLDIDTTVSSNVRFYAADPELDGAEYLVSEGSAELTATRLYLQRRHDFGGPFELELDAGLRYVKFTDIEEDFLLPRFAVGAALAPGHRTRFGVIQDVVVGDQSLAPTTTLGLFPISAPLSIGGTTDAVIFRYDGTFSNRFHLSLEHQSLKYQGLEFNTIDGIGAEELGASYNRTELRGEAWLGRGVGVFASVAVADFAPRSDADLEFGLPGVPKQEANVGFTWVHPSRLRISTRARYIGERVGNYDGSLLEPVWTVDAAVQWESRDKRISLTAEVNNLLDSDVDLGFDRGSDERTMQVSATWRF